MLVIFAGLGYTVIPQLHDIQGFANVPQLKIEGTAANDEVKPEQKVPSFKFL